MRNGRKAALERDILLFIGTYRNENGFSPTIREIGEAVGLRSSSSVQMHLKQMEEAGTIKRRRNMPRTVAWIRPQKDEFV